MKLQKAYIIRITNPLSRQYAKDAAESCERIGLQYEYFEGVEGKTSYDAWMNSGLDIKQDSMNHRINSKGVDPAACCSVSHALIWKKIIEANECAVVLEHDALMLYPIDLDIPDKKVIVLGYKIDDPMRYDHIKAGSPRYIRDVFYHHGAHAYCLTSKTANFLLDELKTIGGGGPIDNRFFLRERWSKIPLAIMLPTPAIGWIRQTTIWDKPDFDPGEMLPEFSAHLKHKTL